jgi:hypothetical protein
MVSEID